MRHLFGVEVLGSLGDVPEVFLWGVSREFAEVVDEVGLVVVAAGVGDLGQVSGAGLLKSGRSLESDDARIEFGRESGEVFEAAFELAFGDVVFRGECFDRERSLVCENGVDRSKDPRKLANPGIEFRCEEFAEDLNASLVSRSRAYSLV